MWDILSSCKTLCHFQIICRELKKHIKDQICISVNVGVMSVSLIWLLVNYSMEEHWNQHLCIITSKWFVTGVVVMKVCSNFFSCKNFKQPVVQAKRVFVDCRSTGSRDGPLFPAVTGSNPEEVVHSLRLLIRRSNSDSDLMPQGANAEYVSLPLSENKASMCNSLAESQK